MTAFKRKRDGPDQPKFYAVRVGRRPGIFSTWSECYSSVNAFPKAIYKSFATETDAQSFVDGIDKTTTPKPSRHSAGWYAVRSGHVPGVYSTWEAAQRQVAGVGNAIYKKFDTKAEAEQFIKHTEPSVPLPHGLPPDDGPALKKAKAVKNRPVKLEPPNAADIDLANYAPGDAPLPAEAEDGFDSSIILDEHSGQLRYRTEEEFARLKAQAVRPAEDSAIVIHTDGSTLGNGQLGAISGVGVFFGPIDKRNVSEALSGKKQTNQRAELTGIIRALELAPRDRKLIIKTDSNYAIQCVTTWFLSWRKNNWQTAQRKAVDNKDLVVKIIDLLEERNRINKHRSYVEPARTEPPQYWDQGPAGVRFDWLKGHSTHEGNQAADRLAVQGAQRARELDLMAEDDVDI